MSAASKLLIIEARFYDDLADALAEGAIKEIEAAGASYDRIAVPILAAYNARRRAAASAS